MSDFLSSYVDTLTDWPIGTIICLLLTALGLVIFGMVLWGCYYLADSAFRPLETACGKVINMSHTPARTEMIPTYNDSTKTTTFTPIYHPESWEAEIHFAGVSGSFDVEESLYDQLRIGDSVHAHYVIGRFSRCAHPRYLTV